MSRPISAYKYVGLAVGPLLFGVLMVTSALRMISVGSEVTTDDLVGVAYLHGLLTVLVWPGAAALLLVLRDWKTKRPLTTSTFVTANLAVGPLIFALLMVGFTAAVLSVNPDPNAGVGLGVFAGSLLLTVLLWPAAVAVLLNVRDRLARQHGPQSDGL